MQDRRKVYELSKTLEIVSAFDPLSVKESEASLRVGINGTVVALLSL
jgi:hypothetical protein